MNTSAINNPLGVLPTPAANSKQNAGSASDAGAFNQMLSQEIADRSNAGNSTNNNANEVTKGPQKDTPGNGDKTKNQATKSEAAVSDKTEAAKTVDEGKTVSVADGKKDETDAEPTTVSAELAAFVAALTQANTAAAQAPTATTTDTTTDAPIVTAATARLGEIDTAIDVTTPGAATTAATTSEKDAIGKKSDFVSALDKATTAASDSSKPPVAAPVKTEAELVTQVVKMLEPATVSNPQTIAAVTTAALQHLNETRDPQSTRLAPQVGSPGWDQALSQKVVWMVQGAQQTATLTLNPPDLGPMQVTVNVSNNQATANFTAHQPEVRHALEAAMPRLREMLNDAGIQLSQSNVSAGSPNQQGASFSEQRQGNRQASRSDDAADPAMHVSHVPVPTGGTGIVDTFA